VIVNDYRHSLLRLMPASALVVVTFALLLATLFITVVIMLLPLTVFVVTFAELLTTAFGSITFDPIPAIVPAVLVLIVPVLVRHLLPLPTPLLH